MALIDEARRRIPSEVRRVARRESLDPEQVRRRLVSGRVVIPCNPVHAPGPIGIGEGLGVKVNVNIGSSRDRCSLREELLKARAAVKLGTDAIMDLSTGGDTRAIRRALLKAVSVPLGTVPIYETALETLKTRSARVIDMSEDAIFATIERQAREGVDFMTVHCGITRESVARLKKSGRIADIVSRGGAFLSAWILHNEKENPLYSDYDYLLELARKHEFALSLGDGLRPGCIADATDRAQLQELIILGELVDRARKSRVQAMVEGPGHVPLDQIEANIRAQKTVCKGAPFYVLGPLVTDIAPGYDHITSAIGGALAAWFGADFLCYVTPSEHLSLPTVEDVRQGTVASRIAAHAADLARGIGWERDIAMARARKALDWEGQFRQAIDPEHAREVRSRHKPRKSERTCTMCGDLCAMAIDDEFV
ncbi:MAG: phosphomethylpyrimidine synthase ThiC [Euryarchaeota archaeon]|nr:phosphomethylpyrimidine synthase ThiC [Euryarchaeota archaeon]